MKQNTCIFLVMLFYFILVVFFTGCATYDYDNYPRTYCESDDRDKCEDRLYPHSDIINENGEIVIREGSK